MAFPYASFSFLGLRSSAGGVIAACLLGHLGERAGEGVGLSVFHKGFDGPFQRLSEVGAVSRFQMGGENRFQIGRLFLRGGQEGGLGIQHRLEFHRP